MAHAYAVSLRPPASRTRRMPKQDRCLLLALGLALVCSALLLGLIRGSRLGRTREDRTALQAVRDCRAEREQVARRVNRTYGP